jgi:hypothetical protein
MASLNDNTSTDKTSATDAVNLTDLARLCTRSVLPNRLSIGSLEYDITDENRDEITQDFMNQNNLDFDFAEKWKASCVGPTDERHIARGPAREKPRPQVTDQK